MVSISYEKLTLSNGLDVILHEDHSLPIAAVNIWYHVGSKDEEIGRTGFAHLFEHVMFEGSKHHNKSYFDPLQKVGANLNGSTNNDRTNYWENVPSNYLDLALWLESDRMGFLMDALDQKRFDIQRDVVKNERRQSYENRPYAMAHLLLPAAVFPSPHPYSWSTIGSQEDLDAADLEDVKAFFRRFYTPSNASLAIAGDFSISEITNKVERYFGDIPSGPKAKRLRSMDSQLSGQTSLTLYDNVQLPRLYIVWPSVPEFSKHQVPLDLLSVVLGDGKSSRLYRTLVYQRKMALDVSVYHHAQEIAGEFHIQVTAAPGKPLDEIEQVVWEEIKKAQTELLTDQELVRAKTRVESHFVRQLERFGGFGGRADLLNHYNTMSADPGVINTDIDRYRGTTIEDLQIAASAILGEKYVRLSVLPEPKMEASSTSIDRSIMPKESPSPTFSPPIPKREHLTNGLEVLILEKRGLPLVSFGILVRSGAITDPPEIPGVDNLTASMLSEGTKNRSSSQIADELESLGSHLNSVASRECALVSTETLTNHWENALEIISDVLINPTFPKHEFSRVRDELIADLRRVSDSPTTIASRASRAILYGPNSRYGHPADGTEASIGLVDVNTLSQHYASHYGPKTATLIVVGDVNENDIMAHAEACLGSWKTKGDYSTEVTQDEVDTQRSTTIYLADKPRAAQSVIRAGHLTVPRFHPDYFAMTLLNYIFGGQFAARLNMNLRQDKGYSYGYMSSIDWCSQSSVLMAGGGVETSVTAEALTETLKEFSEIRGTRAVTQQEFDSARDGILRSLPAQFDTRGQMLQQLTGLIAFKLPLDYFTNLESNIMSITLADVQRVAENRLNSENLKVVIVGDAEAIKPSLHETGLPLVMIDHDGNEID